MSAPNTDASVLSIDVRTNGRCLIANSVIVYGPTEAVLVDTGMSVLDTQDTVDEIRRSGKRLRATLITHAHPDHYFGMQVVREAFPDAPVLARREVRDVMREWRGKVEHWSETFDRKHIPTHLQLPDPLEGDVVEIDGERIEVIDTVCTESLDLTVFYLPSLKTLLAGDLVYNGMHMLTSEVNDLDAWIAELERIRDGWDIERVVMGHGAPSGPEIFDRNIGYLRTRQKAAYGGRPLAEVAAALRKAYPDLILEQAIWMTRGPGFGFAGPERLGMPADLDPLPFPVM
jgi:glyoxylase-like metal-dependent hydrolase (beta-lactamase superfamily II)